MKLSQKKKKSETRNIWHRKHMIGFEHNLGEKLMEGEKVTPNERTHWRICRGKNMMNGREGMARLEGHE